VALFSSICSCTVLTSDVTVISYIQVGDVVYYRGFILSPRADNILTNSSHYIQTGRATLHLYGSQSLAFLTNCPVRVLHGECRIPTADSSTLKCDNGVDDTNSTSIHPTTTVDRSDFSTRCIVIISVSMGIGVLLVTLHIFVLMRRFRRRKASLSEKCTCDRSGIQGSFYHKQDNTIREGLPASSPISTSRYGATPKDTQHLTDNWKVPGQRSSSQCRHDSQDSAYSDNYGISEGEDIDPPSDPFSDAVNQERGVTSV
jgi:hypothetical protein